MVALAEPKKRTKWSLNPRGKLWSNDESKLGQKLLEKMGWSKGKGLGKAEQGELDPIRVNYKMDSKGMGFKGNNDEWVANKEGFDSLLGQLKEHHAEEDATPSQPEEEEARPSRPSLEVRSKHSRARVHYHKYVRGKDLSRYSEEDLASILGNKKTKAPSGEIEIEETTVDTAAGTLTKSHGVTTIQGGNLNAYFASKMAKLTSSSTSNSASNSQGASDEDIVDETEKPIVKKTRKSVIFNEEALVEEFIFNKQSPLEKKKKRKKTEDHDVTDDVAQEPSKKKKKLPIVVRDEEDQPEVEDPKPTKKKKKHVLSPEDSAVTTLSALKDFTQENSPPERCEEDGISEQDSKIKKKKKNKKDKSRDLDQDASESCHTVEISEKKKKKMKMTYDEGVGQEEDVSVAKKKSKSEKTAEVSIEDTCNVATKDKRKKKKEKCQPETIEGQVDNNINEALENLDGCLHDKGTLDVSDPSHNSSELGTKKKKKKKEDTVQEECTKSAEVGPSSRKGKKKTKSKSTSENFNQRVPFKLKDFLPKEEKPTQKPKTEAPAYKRTNGAPSFEYLKSSNIRPEAMYKIKGLYQQARFDLFVGTNLDSIKGYGY